VAVIALLATLLSAVPTEAEVVRLVQSRFERSGRSTPVAEGSLSAAARDVAERALEVGVDAASAPAAVTAAISRHGGWDPSPLVVILRGDPSALLEALQAHDLAEEPLPLLGAGVAQRGNRGAVAVLLARRRIELEAFARAHAAPPARPRWLCGVLRPPLSTAQAFVTRPRGEVEQLDMLPQGTRRCAALAFPTGGRHVVEVLASGPRGPEVAALFFVDVGPVAEGPDEAKDAELQEPAQVRAELLRRINALRVAHAAEALAPDGTLDGVATRWAKRLAAEGFFAHVSPEGSDLRRRLADTGYAFSAAGENLGLASGPLAAHQGIELSPGHRKNLLEPQHQALGLGLARRPDGLTVLVEVLARPAEAPAKAPVADPQEATYQALAIRRARSGVGPLTTSPLLEALAQEHARSALELGLARTELPGHPRLQDRVLETLDQVGTASVDLFVTERPDRITDSRSLKDPRNTQVGVGLARETTAGAGKGRYWIVVIYAGP
jgi:uncharacterized protein YkwD